ncbi:MAG: DUF4823 domain-containing protein, partial [Pseudomonadota bacterium]
ANHKKMKQAIRRFGKELNNKNSVGLFFFAGHGLQINNSNYLLPIGAEIEDEADVEFEAINASRVLSKMSLADNGLNLMILDACRNNPFSRGFRSSSRGLTFMRPASGSLILYATEPGNVAADGSGRNGLFTEKLLASMDTKGLNVEEMFKQTAIEVSKASEKKQVPWSEGVILGNFYFNGNVFNNTIAPAAKLQEINQVANFMGSQENIFWSSVDKNPSIDAYNIYLEQYPKGHYKSLALIKIRQLSAFTDSKPKLAAEPEQIKSTSIVPVKTALITTTPITTATSIADKIIDKPQETDAELQYELSQLINKAHQSEKSLRLTSPKNSSAMHYYSQVLALSANHPEALQGIDSIFNKYISWSKTSIDKENFNKAKRYLNRALKIKPESKTAQAMLTDLEQQSSSQETENNISIRLKTRAVTIAMPADGKFNGKRNPGSGKKTIKVLSKILSSYFQTVKLSQKPKSKRSNVLAARKQQSTVLVIPEILHWEDRNTFWSGKPDKITIKLRIIHVKTGKTLTTKTFKLSSEWSINSSTNKPEQLLIEPVKKYFASLVQQFKG